jgi:hypothetical protein
MPSFDRKAVMDAKRDGDTLRAVLGRPTRRSSDLRPLARAHRRMHRRQMVRRALVVALLLSAALGPAMLAGRSQTSSLLEPETTGSLIGKARLPADLRGSRNTR